MTVAGRELYVYPTLKGLVREGVEVEEAYRAIEPDVVCLALSDRELAEVRYSLRQAGEEVIDDYLPESEGMRRILGVDEAAPGADDGDGDDGDDDENGDRGGDGTDGDGADAEGAEGDALPDELEAPAGMVSREMVDEAMDEPFHPDLVAADAAAAGDQIFVSDTDMAYSRKLASFGDVELPPPSFMEAVRAADRDRVPVVPIDLDDDEYTMVFCDHVGYWQLVSQSRKVRGMRKRLKASSPEEMAAEWDRRIMAIKGFDVLERERERKMATGLVDQLERRKKVLAVIDMVRVDGTLRELADRVGE